MQVYNALQLKKGAKVKHNRMGSITQPLQFLPKNEKDQAGLVTAVLKIEVGVVHLMGQQLVQHPLQIGFVQIRRGEDHFRR